MGIPIRTFTCAFGLHAQKATPNHYTIQADSQYIRQTLRADPWGYFVHKS